MAEIESRNQEGTAPAKAGRLYIVSTPVGNLGDMTGRAVETLRTAEWILAEDTRVTLRLCQIYDIHVRLTSCHRHNEGEKAAGIAERIAAEGIQAALVTDAGTPCISDPGNELVKACIDRGIEVIPIPGCCAAIAAISVSGFDAREFAFYGFLPRTKAELRARLEAIAGGIPVAVIHESPFRIIQLTEMILDVMPDAEMACCCDLTKIHEKKIYGSPGNVLERLKADEKTEKGEYCVVLDLHHIQRKAQESAANRTETLESRLIGEMKAGCSLREAQERLIAAGEKKNAVKQAALILKKLFEEAF